MFRTRIFLSLIVPLVLSSVAGGVTTARTGSTKICAVHLVDEDLNLSHRWSLFADYVKSKHNPVALARATQMAFIQLTDGGFHWDYSRDADRLRFDRWVTMVNAGVHELDRVAPADLRHLLVKLNALNLITYRISQDPAHSGQPLLATTRAAYEYSGDSDSLAELGMSENAWLDAAQGVIRANHQLDRHGPRAPFSDSPYFSFDQEGYAYPVR